ncbi:hypothetical protein FOA52_002424 [Chlamydomonas sp. UWO 241]|nr:hypothetical protein FOA52_002424 [Chlamydomonas sp. UWO 241]
MAALHHTSTPATCTETTDEFGDTECDAVWEPEDLLRVAAVSKELHAAAAADHLWAPLLQRLMHQHPFGKDGHGDCTCPVYPDRIHGTERDKLIKCPTTIWMKRPPILLRCEPCGGLPFECGHSFTEHCCSWKHHQLMLPPEERLPEELWDPHWNRQDWAALTPLGRYKAIPIHVETVMAAFDAPVDEAGMQHMQEVADLIRDNVDEYSEDLISDKKRKRAARRCTAEAVAYEIREDFLIRDFCDNGLTAGSSDAHDFFAGRSKGWAGWQEGGSGSWRVLCGCVTGLDV